eukprot:10585566-Alexandrium_andersonii.AAC.1
MDADDTEHYGDGVSDDEEEMVEGSPAALLHQAKQKELQRLLDFGVYEVVSYEAAANKKVIATRFENQWKNGSIRA